MNNVTYIEEWKEKKYKETGLTNQQIKDIDKFYMYMKPMVLKQNRLYSETMAFMANYTGYHKRPLINSTGGLNKVADIDDYIVIECGP